jgi:hypothetical protein
MNPWREARVVTRPALQEADTSFRLCPSRNSQSTEGRHLKPAENFGIELLSPAEFLAKLKESK